MSDPDKAAALMDDVIGARGIREGVDAMLGRAYSLLHKVNDVWTRRRVRAIWNKEARRIDHREIEEMQFVIEARARHAAYREETARLVAVARNPEADRSRRMAPELGRRLGGVDRPGA